MPITFDDEDLPSQLESISAEARNRLPFGLIGLDEGGRVEVFNDVEREQSGWGDRAIKGLEFFSAVAPCMNTPQIHGRIEHAHREGDLDIEVGHTGDYDDRTRVYRVRMMSRAGGGFWLATQRG